MEKKKVVLMIPQMRHGGAERVVSRLSFLLKENFDITIVVFDDSNITYDVGCEIISLNAKPNSQKNVFKKLFNIIKRVYLYNMFKKNNNIEITYSFGDTANLINILSKGKDKKIISIRGFKRVRIGKGIKDKMFLKPISKLICKRADSVVSVSELMSNTIAEHYKIPQWKIKTSYNGYDIDKIKKFSIEKVPEEFNHIISNNKVIVTAGTFRSEKGYWHLVKAFSIVLKELNNVKLLILGTDYNNNKEKLEKLAQELKISENIIYGGYQENPYKFFFNSTLYVLSSTSEGFPNAMVEAMACNLPIIASDCKSGPREILAPNTNMFSRTETIEMGKFGILVRPMSEYENYDAKFIEECDIQLAKAILLLLEDENLLNKYNYKSNERVKDFDFSKWIKQQSEIISS